MKSIYLLIAAGWMGLWFTPDQQGQRLFDGKAYDKAAEVFVDPMRQGVAWYRAGNFKKAAQAFTRLATPDACYNAGNAWIMLGKYDKAIACFEQALKQRPDWLAAKENRDLAAARAKLVQQEGGDLGDQQEGADQVVFDKKKPGGQETEVAGDKAVSDATVQSIWLRNVQTKPADFLKAKFAYQQAQDEAGDEP